LIAECPDPFHAIEAVGRRQVASLAAMGLFWANHEVTRSR